VHVAVEDEVLLAVLLVHGPLLLRSSATTIRLSLVRLFLHELRI
jgi:hypothetical protein